MALCGHEWSFATIFVDVLRNRFISRRGRSPLSLYKTASASRQQLFRELRVTEISFIVGKLFRKPHPMERGIIHACDIHTYMSHYLTYLSYHRTYLDLIWILHRTYLDDIIHVWNIPLHVWFIFMHIWFINRTYSVVSSFISVILSLLDVISSYIYGYQTGQPFDTKPSSSHRFEKLSVLRYWAR